MCLQLATLVIYANKTIVNLALKRLLNDRLLASDSAPRDTDTDPDPDTPIARISSATRLRFVAAA